MMQTILGSSGIIGYEIAKNLSNYTDKIRLVSRKPRQIIDKAELFTADLTDLSQTISAVKGSEIVYLTVGLKYDINVWRDQWHKIMRNVITACKANNSKLVFFDNVYSYGYVKGKMTEDNPYNPTSQKGEVRAKIAEMLMEEVKAGNIQALIARAADFYGPNAVMGLYNLMIFDNMKKGKKAQWMGDVNAIHTVTYTPDAGKACAILGNKPESFNQIWHLPTSHENITGKKAIEITANVLNQKYAVQPLKKLMLKMVGMFNPVVKELVEMQYQYENDYIFDCSKFEQKFNFKPTSYTEGIKECLR